MVKYQNSSNYNTLSNSILTTDVDTFNTAVGVSNLSANNPPGSIQNVALGYHALHAMLTASSCTGVGYNALAANVDNDSMTALGSSALSSMATGGGSCTAVGMNALTNATTAQSSIAIGVNALGNATSSIETVAIGDNALGSATTASSLMAIGVRALFSNTAGTNNQAVGLDALGQNITGSFNVAIGPNVMASQTDGNQNVGVGFSALNQGITSGSCTAIGFNSLLANNSDSNTAVGWQSMSSHITGSSNVAVGTEALLSSVSATRNVAVGSSALFSTTTGSDNTAVGYQALYVNVASTSTAVGTQALLANTTGLRNTAVGNMALLASTTGTNNTAIGYLAGSAYTGPESQNISIGSNVLGAVGEAAVTRIGATATMLRCFVGGIYGTIAPGTVTANAPVVIDNQGQFGTLGPLTNGQLIIGSSNASPVAATLSPGSNITITNSAGGITISASGIGWIIAPGSLTATANVGYIVNSGTVTIGLPTVSAVGDFLGLMLSGGSQAVLGQAAGQLVVFGDTDTTTGTGGSLTSSRNGDTISLICTVANTTWTASSSMGNWIIV